MTADELRQAGRCPRCASEDLVVHPYLCLSVAFVTCLNCRTTERVVQAKLSPKLRNRTLTSVYR